MSCSPDAASRKKKTQGSEDDCVKPNSRSHGESCALPPATCLRHTIRGFLNAANVVALVSSKSRTAGWCMAIDHLALLQFRLQVYRDNIPPSH
eukprot:6173351-Pleurochrysis_carterae.AAC.2